MPRSGRLFDLLLILRDGQLHRAQDLAQRLSVSQRTLYRDMERLTASGIPVEEIPAGRATACPSPVSLPPLTLSPAEFEVLNLGLAIVAETTDPGLKSAALSLADKIDAALPSETPASAQAWSYATPPFADAARGFSHMATLRAAIRGRQKLELTSRAPDGTLTRRTARPLRLDHWGRVWALTIWCERDSAFRDLRVDLIESARALPELFTDEPGKRLEDRPA